VKASTEELERLLELQTKVFAQRSVVLKAKELSSSSVIEEARAQLAEITGGLSEQRSRVEDVERDIKRLESDVELVEKRLQRDLERMNQSSNPKDIAGIEHEIASLNNRKSILEDSELELMEQRDLSLAELGSLEKQRKDAEDALESTKANITAELEALRAENTSLVAAIEDLRAKLPTELVELFDKKIQRGPAVGRLTGSSCSACNMNLNSTSMAEISRVPMDELATCSECSAMLVRA
jgi:predicted  nucleic acid-binding Zn-ribbon protein